MNTYIEYITLECINDVDNEIVRHITSKKNPLRLGTYGGRSFYEAYASQVTRNGQVNEIEIRAEIPYKFYMRAPEIKDGFMNKDITIEDAIIHTGTTFSVFFDTSSMSNIKPFTCVFSVYAYMEEETKKTPIQILTDMELIDNLWGQEFAIYDPIKKKYYGDYIIDAQQTYGYDQHKCIEKYHIVSCDSNVEKYYTFDEGSTSKIAPMRNDIWLKNSQPDVYRLMNSKDEVFPSHVYSMSTCPPKSVRFGPSKDIALCFFTYITEILTKGMVFVPFVYTYDTEVTPRYSPPTILFESRSVVLIPKPGTATYETIMNNMLKAIPQLLT